MVQAITEIHDLLSAQQRAALVDFVKARHRGMNRPAALLIDDDAKLGGLLKEYLGQNEIDLPSPAMAERGLRDLQAGRFDAVLLDLMLPGIDGLEVCRRLRAQPESAMLPVIMLTAKGDDVDKIVGLELGADDYLAKPFNPRELLARIRARARAARTPRRPASRALPRRRRSRSTSARARSWSTAGARC